MTAAGVSAGIELGLLLAASPAGKQTARSLQLLLGYDPHPPYDSGSAASAPQEMVSTMRALRHSILDRAANPEI